MSLELRGTLVLAGAGKMGGAMLQGWLAQGIDPKKIVVLDPAPPPEVKALIETHAVRFNAAVKSIIDTEVLLIAVKPQVMDEVLPGIVPLAATNALIISIAAGKTIASFERYFGKNTAVIRTIPNTPAAIGRGITAMAANRNVAPKQLQLASALLSAVGEVVTVPDESMIDPATAVSGSGPAYVFYMTECLAAAGAKAGLPPDISMQLARVTVAGAGELMRASGEAAAVLRENVTSRKGTTDAALQVLMSENGLQPLFDKAIAAATQRARELAN